MGPRNFAVLLSASLAIVGAFIFRKYMVGSVTSAQLVIKNAVIYTSDPSLPWAESMAIRSGRILALGNFSSLHAQGFIGRQTRFLDLQGKFVVPGFIDSHVHLISGGLQMAQVDLRAVKSKSEFIRKVEQVVHGMDKDHWVLGGGWNNEYWGGELPQASWFDNITRDNPVWLSRMDGHMGLANSMALAKVGISNSTDDPVGGSIIKSMDGAPTGLLVDAAMQLLLPHIPDPTIQERRNAMIRASKIGLSRGVTAVVDFGRYFPGSSTNRVWQDFYEVYRWADESSRMLLRVCLFFPLETWSLVADTFKNARRTLSQWIHIGGVKAFADGSLGSNSALFYEPYVDDGSNHGLHVANPDWLSDTVIKADKIGIQVAIHAIGDKANDIVLSIFEDLIFKNGVKDRRFRIEHAQHLAAGAVDRFGANDLIASVQPQHLLDDAASAVKKLGERRAVQESYLFNSLLSRNARLAFGSDWPVAELDPIGGIKAATRRIPTDWHTPWIPSERITVDAALNGYTISAAFAAFMENEIGSLSIGKWADFVVLSRNLWNVTDVEDFPFVLATYIGGVHAYP
uniref:Amidohydrolase 3 domain-containing protein n=2 Tax=Araucaria cunninghamii TaxID=56994 RepID=A0A0D6R1A8_ARACU